MGRSTMAWMLSGLMMGCQHVPTEGPVQGADPAIVFQLEADKAALTDTVAAQDAEIAELQALLEARAASDGFADDLDACDVQRADLQYRLDRNRAELTAMKARLDALGERPTPQAHQELQARIASLERELMAQPSPEALARARQRMMELEGALAQAPSPQELDQALRQLDRVQSQLAAARADLAGQGALAEEVDRLRGRVEELRRRLASAPSPEELAQALHQLEVRAGQVEALRRDLGLAEAKIGRLEQQLRDGAGSNAEVARLRQRVDALTAELAQRTTEIEAAQVRIRRLQAQLADAGGSAGEVARLRERVQTLSAELSAAQADAAKASALRAQLADARRDLSEAQARVRDLEGQLAALPSADDVGRAKARMADLRDKLERARGRITELEGQLASAG